MVSYRVRVRLKGFPLQTATFQRLSDAKRWVQSTESAIREGRHFKTSEAKKHTLGDTIQRYCTSVLKHRPRSAAQREQQLKWWNEQIGSYCLADVTPSLLSSYKEKLAEGITHNKRTRSPASVNRYLAALSHVFSVAANEWGWLDSNPMRKVAKLKEPRGRVRFLSDDERKALLEACRNSKAPALHLIVVLALSTGMRRGEILGLTWDNVDLARGRITLHETKNGDRRVVPLTALALELMREHAKVRQLKNDMVFPSVSQSRRLQINQAWGTALEKAKITDFRFHDLRHSAASYLAMNGATMAEIAEVLGHKTLAMVKRYSHLSESHVAGVVERMNHKVFAV